ncbi:phage holin family protein [Catellatospora vulcania]|uniref:phage holin family protein n=1 Tax=Catellatospora vulcania TaxID=1460450 RepID=UPI0012D4BC44|nr:phage holin family protein [Catellatospora vulcania]
MSKTHRPSSQDPGSTAAEQLTSLSRTEFVLARTWLHGASRDAGAAQGRLSTAGLVFIWVLPALVVAGVLGLAEVMPLWAAVLCVASGLVLLGVGLGLAGRSRSRVANPPVGQQAWRPLRADAEGLDKSRPASTGLERRGG